MGSELRRSAFVPRGDSARCRRSALPIDVRKATRAAMLPAAPINQPSAGIIVSFNSSQPRKTNRAPGNTQQVHRQTHQPPSHVLRSLTQPAPSSDPLRACPDSLVERAHEPPPRRIQTLMLPSVERDGGPWWPGALLVSGRRRTRAVRYPARPGRACARAA